MIIFLGGTCNGSTWRDKLIPLLTIDYFNPVVENWTEECQQEELRQREECDFCLYVITPQMLGFYSIAEVVDDSNKRPTKTIFCFINDGMPGGRDFSPAQLKSLKAVSSLIRKNGALVMDSLMGIAMFFNAMASR